MIPEAGTGDVRETAHRHGDDLLSAGLGLTGLSGIAPRFSDPAAPTSIELRRRAIHASWHGIADVTSDDGYGRCYGAVPNVPGREYAAFARLPDVASSYRVLVQAPDAFNADARCLLVAPASGSRGVYGGLALAGAWGLPRGCAVVHTDKGAGGGYFDLDSDSGVALDGTRARRGDGELEFEPRIGVGGSGVAIKHAHSQDHPEADWDRHVLHAVVFGLTMMDRAYPALAPFTPANTRVIAVGLSNGGGAVLRAAGIDSTGVLDAVVAIAPNVHVAGRGRALYDFASDAAWLLPVALLETRFDDTPFARVNGIAPAPWRAHCRYLRETQWIDLASNAACASHALEILLGGGWTIPAIKAAATSTAFDLWRALGATYASSYLRCAPDSMPCSLRFAALDTNGHARVADNVTRAAWWADAGGIPPGAGVALIGAEGGVDVATETLLALRALFDQPSASNATLHAAIAKTTATMPRADLPIVIVHGESDGLLPIDLTSAAYVDARVASGCAPAFWRIADAQHFDAFISLPGLAGHHVPLLPHALAALDAVWARVFRGDALPATSTFAAHDHVDG